MITNTAQIFVTLEELITQLNGQLKEGYYSYGVIIKFRKKKSVKARIGVNIIRNVNIQNSYDNKRIIIHHKGFKLIPKVFIIQNGKAKRYKGYLDKYTLVRQITPSS